MDSALPKAVARRMLQCAAGWKPITPLMAQRMLRILSRLPSYVPPEHFLSLEPQQQRVLAAYGARLPRAAIARQLGLTSDEIEQLLRQSAATLCGNLLYWRDDGDGAGDRAPQPRPRGDLPTIAAAAPLPPSTEQAALAAVQELLLQSTGGVARRDRNNK